MKNGLKYFLLFALLVPCWIIATHYDVDLVVLHHTANLVPQDLSHVYFQNGSSGRFFYGPVALLFLKPLALFSYPQAIGIWNLWQTLAYILFWFCLYRLYPFLRDPSLLWSWGLVWIIAINPIHNNFQSGNINLTLASLLLLAESLSRNFSAKIQFLGGVICALAGAIKIFPFFIAAYYVLCRPKPVRWGVLAGIVLSVALPFGFFGIHNASLLFNGFYDNITSYSADNPSSIMDILCLPSLLLRSFGSTPNGVLMVRILLVGVASLFFFSAWRRSTNLSPYSALQTHLWALAMALMTFLNPSSRPHAFVFYVPAFCSLLEHFPLEHPKPWPLAGIFLSALLLAFTAEGIVGRDLNNKLEILSVPTYGMILFIGMLVTVVYARRGSEEVTGSGDAEAFDGA